jgi:hypothetical protein
LLTTSKYSFQSDHDLDLISDLDFAAGIGKLRPKKAESKATEKNDKEIPAGAGAVEDDDLDDHDPFRYSIYADHCQDKDDAALVREHLDSGVLDDLFRKMANDGYALVILGACAMTLGCRISTPNFHKLARLYNRVGLMDEAVEQMKNALDEYKKGEPYDFHSAGLVEAMMNAAENPEGENPKNKEPEKKGEKPGVEEAI